MESFFLQKAVFLLIVLPWKPLPNKLLMLYVFWGDRKFGISPPIHFNLKEKLHIYHIHIVSLTADESPSLVSAVGFVGFLCDLVLVCLFVEFTFAFDTDLLSHWISNCDLEEYFDSLSH